MRSQMTLSLCRVFATSLIARLLLDRRTKKTRLDKFSSFIHILNLKLCIYKYVIRFFFFLRNSFFFKLPACLWPFTMSLSQQTKETHKFLSSFWPSILAIWKVSPCRSLVRLTSVWVFIWWWSHSWFYLFGFNLFLSVIGVGRK